MGEILDNTQSTPGHYILTYSQTIRIGILDSSNSCHRTAMLASHFGLALSSPTVHAQTVYDLTSFILYRTYALQTSEVSAEAHQARTLPSAYNALQSPSPLTSEVSAADQRRKSYNSQNDGRHYRP